MKISAFPLRWLALTSTLFCLPVALAAEMPIARLFPTSGAANVCPDTPLRVTFAVPLTAGRGKIEIHQASDGRVVESIDLSAKVASQSIGGLSNYNYYPLVLSGKQATINLRHGTLRYGSRYYVTIDAGAFAAENDASAELGAKAWQFSTKSAPPAPTQAYRRGRRHG